MRIGDSDYLTVGELLAVLNAAKISPDAIISMEGCDCYQWAGSVDGPVSETNTFGIDREQGEYIKRSSQVLTLRKVD